MLAEGGKQRQFTFDHVPDADGFAEHLNQVARHRIILDDLNNLQNIDPVYHPRPDGFSVTNFIRGGDTVSSLTGVLHWSFAGSSGSDAWRVRPQSSNPVVFHPDNPRPPAPADVGGSIKVASLNALNYFTTIDLGPPDCGLAADQVSQCDGQNATIHVSGTGEIVGGPLDGHPYHGFLPGTQGADVIVGTNGRDLVIGRAGDDRICGLNSADLIDGRSGNDTIFGGDGRDLLRGGGGKDTCDGGEGRDTALSCEFKTIDLERGLW